MRRQRQEPLSLAQLMQIYFDRYSPEAEMQDQFGQARLENLQQQTSEAAGLAPLRLAALQQQLDEASAGQDFRLAQLMNASELGQMQNMQFQDMMPLQLDAARLQNQFAEQRLPLDIEMLQQAVQQAQGQNALQPYAEQEARVRAQMLEPRLAAEMQQLQQQNQRSQQMLPLEISALQQGLAQGAQSLSSAEQMLPLQLDQIRAAIAAQGMQNERGQAEFSEWQRNAPQRQQAVVGELATQKANLQNLDLKRLHEIMVMTQGATGQGLPPNMQKFLNDAYQQNKVLSPAQRNLVFQNRNLNPTQANIMSELGDMTIPNEMFSNPETMRQFEDIATSSPWLLQDLQRGMSSRGLKLPMPQTPVQMDQGQFRQLPDGTLVPLGSTSIPIQLPFQTQPKKKKSAESDPRNMWKPVDLATLLKGAR